MCFVAALGLLTPRFIIVVLWLFTDFMSRAYQEWWLPTLGFFLLPTTTIGYAIAKNDLSNAGGTIRVSGFVVIALGVLIDVGLIGSGRGLVKWRRRRS
jgi:hypothetical protein